MAADMQGASQNNNVTAKTSHKNIQTSLLKEKKYSGWNSVYTEIIVVNAFIVFCKWMEYLILTIFTFKIRKYKLYSLTIISNKKHIFRHHFFFKYR